MSSFTYPPPPPPPPSSSSNAPSGPPSQHGRRIPTVHNGNNGRDRKFDGGRGSHQASRGRPQRPHQNGQHHAPSSGGHVATMNHHYPPLNVQANVAHQPLYSGPQQPYAAPPAAWSHPHPLAYASGQAPPNAYNQYGSQPLHGNAPAPPLQAYNSAPYAAQSHPYAPYASPQVPASGYPLQTAPYPQPAPYAQSTAAQSQQQGGGHHYKPHNDENGPGHGHKRKREQSPSRGVDRRGPNTPSSNAPRQAQGKGSGKPIVKPKVLTAPSVPSFGFHALPPRPPPIAADTGSNSRDSKDLKKKKKRKTNQLGLTPKGDVHDVTDEEIDEEAAFVKSGAPQMIEFRGRTVSVSTAAEIQAWIAERRKKFPTAARVAERKAAQEAKKKQADEKRKQLLEERQKNAQKKQSEQKQAKQAKMKLKTADEVSVDAAGHPTSAMSTEELQRKKLEKHLRKAEKLRHMLENSAIKDEPSSDGKPDNVSKPPALAGGASSSASSGSDSDAAPDVEPVRRTPHDQSKSAHQNSRNAKTGRNDFTNVPCKYFVRDGHCRRKHCRFLHSQPSTTQKKTLFERLKDQEIREESLQVLEIIKQLGDCGSLEPSH